jgi:hypothetical protein
MYWAIPFGCVFLAVLVIGLVAKACADLVGG